MAHKDKRIDVRVYLEPDEYEYLKAVASENGISMSELLRTCTLKKCKFPKKKKASQKLTLPSKATETETSSPPEQTREQTQKRLDEIDAYIKANKGNIPKVEFYRLKAEQAELQEMLEN